jgi:hypothetical protein
VSAPEPTLSAVSGQQSARRLDSLLPRVNHTETYNDEWKKRITLHERDDDGKADS